LLLVAGIVILVSGYLPNVVSVKTRAAICRVFQSNCDEDIPTNTTARNRPNPVVPLAKTDAAKRKAYAADTNKKAAAGRPSSPRARAAAEDAYSGTTDPVPDV
jgi:hypothetical protein